MAKDDDDEAFGDFAFAPFQSNPKSNGLNSSADEDEDDDWGDFVQPPQQSKPSAALTWVKPSGALPLSIFGDAEEEEEKVDNRFVARDLNQGKSNGTAGDFSSAKVEKSVYNSHSFSITDLYNQYSQIKPDNRAVSESTGKVDSVENGVHSSSNQNDARSVAVVKNMDLDAAPGTSNHNQLTNKADNEEFSFKAFVPDPIEKKDLFGGWTLGFNGFSTNSNTISQTAQMWSSDLDLYGQKQQWDGSATAIDDDDDGDGWEFKDAHTGSHAQDVNNNVDLVVHEVLEKSTYSSGTGIDLNKSLDPSSNGSIDFSAWSMEPVDYFANSSGISSTSREVDLFGIQPSTATLSGFTSDVYPIIEQNYNKDPLNHIAIDDLDESFGEFAAAETGPKPGEVSTDVVFSPIKDAVSAQDGKTQEKDKKLNYHTDTIPLSIFGNEGPERCASSDVQDVFMHQSTFEQKSNHTAVKVISINDLISNLYSQAEQTSPISTAKNPTGSLFNLPSATSSFNVINYDDLLYDSSWDFKDASQMRVDSEASLNSIGDTKTITSSKLKLNNYFDFYSKLKEHLCFVTKCHIESLKETQGDTAVSGEDAGAASLDNELQLVCKELERMNILSEESSLQDRHSGDSHINDFVQVLLEPQFQMLDSEYCILQNLLLAEKNLGSAVELIRHTNTMLRILTIGTLEEQKVYVSLWSEMISVCALELKHGALIWNQAVQKHLQSQLLSEPQGRKFVLALGEIYRVIVILEASAKIFKPWILSSSVESPAIDILLEECHAVWSTSGLDEALSSVSTPATFDSKSLSESIKDILGLDTFKLQNYVFTEKESRCRMSLLTTGVVPGLKMIMWGHKHYFVTLANLWANLVSCHPPKLPQLNLG